MMTQKENHSNPSNNDNTNILFQKAYANAVKQSMEILGEVSKVVQDYVEDKYSIQLENTCNNPSALSEALNFAIDGGKRIIERRIIRLLSKSLKLDYHASTLINFEQQISDMRNSKEGV